MLGICIAQLRYTNVEIYKKSYSPIISMAYVELTAIKLLISALTVLPFAIFFEISNSLNIHKNNVIN